MMSGSHLSKDFFDLVKSIGESRSKQEEDKIITHEVLVLKSKMVLSLHSPIPSFPYYFPLSFFFLSHTSPLPPPSSALLLPPPSFRLTYY